MIKTTVIIRDIFINLNKWSGKEIKSGDVCYLHNLFTNFNQAIYSCKMNEFDYAL